MRTNLSLTALLLGLVSAAPLAAQQTAASPTQLVGEALSGRTLGYRAALSNPAFLAGSGSSSSLFTLTAEGGFKPLGLTYLEGLGDYIETEEKAQLMDLIRAEGSLSANAAATMHWLGFSFKGFALNVYTDSWARGEVAPQLVELALYGNVGQSGAETSLSSEGSRMRAAAASHVALSHGLTLPLPVPGKVSAGATLRRSFYHYAADGYDTGSEVLAPLALDLNAEGFTAVNGAGVGLDLGASWEIPVVKIGLSLRNVVQTVSFNPEQVSFYRASAFASVDTSYAQTDTLAYANLSAEDQASVDARMKDISSPRELSLTASTTLGMATLGAELRKEFTDVPSVGLNQTELSLAGRIRPISFVSFSAGMGVGDAAGRISGGMGLHLGPLNLDLAASQDLGSSEMWGISAGLSLGRF